MRAEISMEHNLCRPAILLGDWYKSPAPSDALGAVKAINAASLALSGDGSHHLRLDQVIRTMRDGGGHAGEI